MQDASGNEFLLFDGESTRLALSVEMAVSERLQLGVELPYVLHESGGLDGVVLRWHDWFGLPDGIRNLVPEDQLDFRYAQSGDFALDIQQNQRGPGDVRLLAAWQLARGPLAATALRASLKLPTGDSGTLTGSGATDLSAGLAGDYRQLFGRDWLGGFYRADLTLVGRPDRLPGRAKRLVGSLAGGFSARVNGTLELAAQARLRSAGYDSELDLIGEPALLLNVGGTLTLGKNLRLAIAVGEDVSVNSAPDVTFGLTLRYGPAAN